MSVDGSSDQKRVIELARVTYLHVYDDKYKEVYHDIVLKAFEATKHIRNRHEAARERNRIIQEELSKLPVLQFVYNDEDDPNTYIIIYALDDGSEPDKEELKRKLYMKHLYTIKCMKNPDCDDYCGGPLSAFLYERREDDRPKNYSECAKKFFEQQNTQQNRQQKRSFWSKLKNIFK